MSTGKELAGQIDALTADLVSIVDGCSDEQWAATTSEEGWPVNVVMLHMADVLGIVGSIAVDTGSAPAIELTNEQIDAINDQRARERAGTSKADVRGQLSANGAAVATALTTIDDARLSREVAQIGGNSMTLHDMVQFATIAHFQGHAASVRATLAG